MHKSFLCCLKGTSLDVENWFEHVFVLLSHLAAKRPVTRLWATTMVLFEKNTVGWVFGTFMLLMTFYGETMVFIKLLLKSWVFLLENRFT